MKHPCCVACGHSLESSKQIRISALFKGVAYYSCPGCESLGVSPAPPESELNRYYKDFYIGAWKRSLVDRWIQVFRGWSEAQRARSLIRAGLSQDMALPSGMIVVDCGAGSGALSRSLRQRLGPEAFLIPIDAARGVLSLRGPNTEPWCVNERELLRRLAKKGGGKFDLVFFSHTLEHFREPQKVLAAFASRLNTGGRIIIDFPHGRHPLYLRGDDVKIPDLYFFTEQGMEAMSLGAGCRILAFHGISPGPASLAAVENAAIQYLSAALFILKGWVTGDGYFSATPPVWLRVVLKKA